MLTELLVVLLAHHRRHCEIPNEKGRLHRLEYRLLILSSWTQTPSGMILTTDLLHVFIPSKFVSIMTVLPP